MVEDKILAAVAQAPDTRTKAYIGILAIFILSLLAVVGNYFWSLVKRLK